MVANGGREANGRQPPQAGVEGQPLQGLLSGHPRPTEGRQRGGIAVPVNGARRAYITARQRWGA